MKISLLTGVVRCPIVKGDTENMSQKLRQRYHLVQKVLRGKISLNDAEGRGFFQRPTISLAVPRKAHLSLLELGKAVGIPGNQKMSGE